MPTVQKQLHKLALIVDPKTKKGQRFQDGSAAVNISGVANTTPIRITTASNHGLQTGDQAYVTGTTVSAANNSPSNPNWAITVINNLTFDLDGSSAAGAGSGGTVTGALIGSVDGAGFPRQRLLDIYNEARLILFNALVQGQMFTDVLYAISGNVVYATSQTFAGGVWTKAAGYLKGVTVFDAANAEIPILPHELMGMVQSGGNTHLIESSTNRFLFDIATGLKSLSGSTYVPNAGTYTVVYVGISEWTLAQVLAGLQNESYNDEYNPYVLQIAEALAKGQGAIDVEKLARTLIAKKAA